MSKGARRWGQRLLIAVIALGSLWIIGQSWSYRRSRRAMAEIKKEIEAGRHSTAARGLVAMLADRPDSDEAAYLLGTCEKATGRDRAAADAWKRVPPGSPFALQAIQRLMELEIDSGRLAGAEQLIERAMDDPMIDASALPLYLGPSFWLQGRIDEAEQAIEHRWDHLNTRGEGVSEKAIDLVRLHVELRRSPLAVDMVRNSLEHAGQLAPDDDRVWLGKANLAVRTDSYDEAERWLAACRRRRPGDVSVWRARLRWAVATNRVAEAREACEHLPVEEMTPAQVPKLAAWLAGRRGDRESEQRALERVIAVDPADFAALDRLAELAGEQGQPGRAARLREHRSEIDRLRARYEKLYQRNQPARDAAESAYLAERLGRRFEARAFMTLAVAIDPDRADLRHNLAELDRHDRISAEPGRTLAAALAAGSEPVSADPTPLHDFPPPRIAQPKEKAQQAPPTHPR